MNGKVVFSSPFVQIPKCLCLIHKLVGINEWLNGGWMDEWMEGGTVDGARNFFLCFSISDAN